MGAPEKVERCCGVCVWQSASEVGQALGVCRDNRGRPQAAHHTLAGQGADGGLADMHTAAPPGPPRLCPGRPAFPLEGPLPSALPKAVRVAAAALTPWKLRRSPSGSEGRPGQPPPRQSSPRNKPRSAGCAHSGAGLRSASPDPQAAHTPVGQALLSRAQPCPH